VSNSYRFYVGTTDSWYGHWSITIGAVQDGALLHPNKVHGVWDGAVEAVGTFDIELSNDGMAERVAYYLTVATGNDCVLVTRGLDAFEKNISSRTMARFIVRADSATTGNRTLNSTLVESDTIGTVFRPDITGDTIAFLVYSDATIGRIES
jgi:hypothetical protein